MSSGKLGLSLRRNLVAFCLTVYSLELSDWSKNIKTSYFGHLTGSYREMYKRSISSAESLSYFLFSLSCLQRVLKNEANPRELITSFVISWIVWWYFLSLIFLKTRLIKKCSKILSGVECLVSI